MDTAEFLSATRTFLAAEKFMRPSDSFLTSTSAVIPVDQEDHVTLGAAVKDDVLQIGEQAHHSPIGGGDGVDRYNAMTDDQKLAVFDNIQLFRGFTFGSSGFQKTFKNLYSYAKGSLPNANMPRVLTELDYSYSFSEVTRDLTVFGSTSASASLSAPFGSAEAEYNYEHSKSTHSSEVTEYLTARYESRKVLLQVDASAIVGDPSFVAAVKQAIGQAQTAQDASNLVEVLNEWGYFIPWHFTLGGLLYSTDSTKISEFSEAESEKEEFGGSFKAEFDGIGGGAAYKQANGSDQKTTSTHKFEDMTIQQVGGKAGTNGDFEKWNASLDEAITWDISSAEKLYPSLVLLARSDVDGAKQVLGKAVQLLDNFGTNTIVKSLQEYVSLSDYATTCEAILNPFG
ncbi:MAG: MAC/perforin domain-containing protein [Actinomycetota bacterium]